ncbi:MAG: hypothetical protein COA92_09140 [Sulfurovum sp.]|nr:MAG: hypothetical protein COA92_09140 [Sulfurovum sp.]
MIFLPPKSQEKKISLNIQQVVTPPPAPKPIPQPIITPPVPPQPVVQKEVKKKLLDTSEKVFAQKNTEENNVTKIEPKPQKKIVKKEVTKKPKKVVKEKRKKKKRVVKKRKAKRSNDRLANMLMRSSTSFYPSQSRSPSNAGSYGDRMIKKLYGKEFNTYSNTQKKFIKNNLGTIHRITQKTLTRNGYPDIAVRTKQQGTNVVAFYLHPNGDITGLKLKRHIGYEALDQNTLQVIRLAYKNYPLPNQKTKIIFYVRYSMY